MILFFTSDDSWVHFLKKTLFWDLWNETSKPSTACQWADFSPSPLPL